jgi:hypothetical protein
VFRRFRDTMRELPALKDPWSAWLSAREEARAIRWLLAGDHVDEIEADTALTARREAAAAALDRVRATRGPTFDIDEAASRWADVVDALDRGDSVALTRDGRAFAVISTFRTDV